MATLRHSLSFPPGTLPKSFLYVERFVGHDWHELDVRRQALYAVAGLYALQPESSSHSLAQALGELLRRKQAAQPAQQRHSLEWRFIALLEADADTVMSHLRQAVKLLASEGLGFNHSALLADLAILLDERASPARKDSLKRRWAQGFYRAPVTPTADAVTPVPSDTVSSTH